MGLILLFPAPVPVQSVRQLSGGALPILHPGWTVPLRPRNLRQSLGQCCWSSQCGSTCCQLPPSTSPPAHLELDQLGSLACSPEVCCLSQSGYHMPLLSHHDSAQLPSRPAHELWLAYTLKVFFLLIPAWENQYTSLPYGGKKSHFLR